MSVILKKFVNELITHIKGEQPPQDVNGDGLPEAARALIMNEQGLLLAVSRRDDPTNFGLPGGKVDVGENPRAAAIRELKEETGFDAISVSKYPIFSFADGSYVTHTFAVEVSGTPQTCESGVIKWVHPDVLLRGSFGVYNRLLFRHIGWDY